MPGLAQQRCLNHALREAVARCPECHQFFCRECITEHEDRVICANCLKKQAQPARNKPSRLAGVFRIAQGLAGLFLAWMFFYLVGQGLLSIDAAFHEGTIWKAGIGESGE